MTASFESRARSRGLVVPGDESPQAISSGKKTVVWNGRAMELVDERAQGNRGNRFTFHTGESHVGYTETPTVDSTKLISGDYRVINEPATTKEGTAWKPGNRYSNRCLKLDPNSEGEQVLTNGKYTAFVMDADNVHLKSGRIIWSEGRFRHCPGRMGHEHYEAMCNKLRDTSQWKKARPPSKFEPGFAEYCTGTTAASNLEAAHTRLPDVPEDTECVREADGSITIVPSTAALAQDFSASKLVPAQLGELPNGPASFSVHSTPTDDLRWLTRVVAQRTAGNEPIRGPGSLLYFESYGVRGSTIKRTTTAAH